MTANGAPSCRACGGALAPAPWEARMAWGCVKCGLLQCHPDYIEKAKAYQAARKPWRKPRDPGQPEEAPRC